MSGLKRYSLVFTTVILAACGSDNDGRSVTEMVATGDDLSGQWSGTWSNSSTALEACGAASIPLVVTLTQAATALTGKATLECTGVPIEVALAGSVSATRVELKDTNSRDVFSLAIESDSTLAGTVVDNTGTISADIALMR